MMKRDYSDLQNANMRAVGHEVKETPFSRLSVAVERLREARTRVNEVANALCGEAPPTPPATGAKVNRMPIVGSGMLGGIEEMAEAIEGMVDGINDDLARFSPHV